MSVALKLSHAPERELKLVNPPDEINRLLREFLEGESPDERRALRKSLNAILNEVQLLRREGQETTDILRGEIRGVSLRVTALERAREHRNVTIPPIASLASPGPDTGSFFLSKDAAAILQKSISEANAAASWQAVKGGAWKVLLVFLGAAMIAAGAAVWRKLAG